MGHGGRGGGVISNSNYNVVTPIFTYLFLCVCLYNACVHMEVCVRVCEGHT